LDSVLVGVLAIQGDYDAHRAVLEQLGAQVRLVRKAEELEGLDGLVIPGGESSTFLNFLRRDNFLGKLHDFVATKPAFGTCAGAILLAKKVENPAQEGLGVLDVSIRRNAYGRQLESSIESADSQLPGGPLEMVFIRAPRFLELGKDVEVLARRDGDPVLVRQKHVLAATFHPELSNDSRVHEEFLKMVRQHKH